jgi:2-polyprenyl-3-methyl-5-hydroxy-6-metoxy-1,4-benzoquinol methylase
VVKTKEDSLPACRLCNAPMSKQLGMEEHSGVLYHVAHCTRCDLIQAVEHVASVSPDYIDLDESAVSTDRLWCQGIHKHPAFRQWFALSRKFSAKPGMRVLDIGCGTGGFLQFASQCGYQAYGFDASRAQAEHAASEFPSVRCSTSPVAYLRELDQPNLKFDIVTLWDVFEHIRNPLSFLEEIKGVLDRNGVLFLSIPNGGALRWKLPLYRAFRRSPDLTPWEHVFYYSPRALALCLEKAGFRVLKYGAVACYPRPISVFEICRRLGFTLFRCLPFLAPQIFAVAKVAAAQGVEHR